MNIEKNADMAQAEKDRLIKELRANAEAEEKAKRKKEKMIKRLRKMEEKMVVGNQAAEIAKNQKKELKKTRKDLQAEINQQTELEMKLQEEEDESMMIKERFASLAEELEFQSNKLMRLIQKYEEAAHLLQNIEDDFDRERNDMYDTIYELTN
jgi:kinesin family protein 3/17